MKKFFQSFFLFLFCCFVIGLGIFAYKLASNSLVFAFVWQEKQYGNVLRVAFDRPGTISRLIPSGALLDFDVIKSAILVNNTSPTEEMLNSFEYIFSSWYIEIRANSLEAGDELKISHERYNTLKKTSYNLPKDIILTREFHDKKFQISPFWEPKNREFSVEMSGFSEDITHIKWYAYYPEMWYSCFENWVFWNPENFREVSVENIMYENLENNMMYKISLDINTTKNRQCLVAWVSWEILPVLDKNLENLSIVAKNGKILDRENNLKSQIDFHVSEKIFTNISDTQKVALLKKISISPNIPLTEADIELKEDGFSLFSDFQYGKKYTIHLTDISDIYGREVSYSYTFTPEKEPFLDIELENFQNIFRDEKSISAKIFAIDTPKKEYEIKLCRLDLSGYDYVSRLEKTDNSEKIREFYEFFMWENTSNCLKNTIVLEKESMITWVNISEIFKENLRSGLYAVAFKNYEDILNFSHIATPKTFAILPNNLTIHTHESGKMDFLVTNAKSGVVRANQDIELSLQISEDFVSWKKQNWYSTGVILGQTDSEGFLRGDFSEQINTLLQENNKTEGKFVVISRGNDGIAMSEIFLEKTKNIHYKDIFLDRNIYAPKENVIISGFFDRYRIHEKNIKISLYEWENLISEESAEIIDSGDFSHILVAPENVSKYRLVFSFETGELIDEKTFFIEKNEKSALSLETIFSVLDAEKGIIKHLRKNKNTTNIAPWYSDIFEWETRFEAKFITKNDIWLPRPNAIVEYKLLSRNRHFWEKILIEGATKTGLDGVAYVYLDAHFESFFADTEYILESHSFDVLTGKMVKNSQKILLSLPEEYKIFDDINLPQISLEKQVFLSGTMIHARLHDKDGNDFVFPQNFFSYEIIPYNEKGPIVTEKLLTSHFYFPPLDEGVYTLKIFPNLSDEMLAREKFSSSLDFAISDTFSSIQKNAIIAHKKYYKPEEKPSFLITSENEKWHIILHAKTDTTIVTEYITFSDYFMQFSSEKIANLSGKISVRAQFFDENNMLFGENTTEFEKASKEIVNITTNINNQKYFQNTIDSISVSVLWNEKINRPAKIFIKKYENNLQNTVWNSNFVFENNEIKIPIDAGIITENGRYSLEITAYTDNNQKIFYQRDFEMIIPVSLEAHSTENAFPWDKIDISVSAENFTNAILPTWLELSINGEKYEKIDFILNISKKETHDFFVKIPENSREKIDYKITLGKGNDVIKTITQSVKISDIPFFGWDENKFFLISEKTEIPFTDSSFLDPEKSKITLSLSTDLQFLIPVFWRDIVNSSKISLSEKILVLAIKRELLSSSFSSLISADEYREEVKHFFKNTSISIWKHQEQMSDDAIARNLILLYEMKKYGISLSENFFQEMEMYVQEKRENPKLLWEKLLIFYRDFVLNKDSDEILSLSYENFSPEEMLYYAEIVKKMWKILPENFKKILDEKFLNLKENDEKFIEFRLKYAQFVYDETRKTILFDILEKRFSTISTLEEKTLFIKNLLKIPQRNPVNSTEIRTESLLISENFDEKKIFWQGEFSRSKIGKILEIIPKTSPIFFLIEEKNSLYSPMIFPEKTSPILKISRKIEEIDERYGMDNNWEFLSKTEKRLDEFLQKNQLYKVTISLQKSENYSDKIILRHTLPNASEIFINPDTNARWKIFSLENRFIAELQNPNENSVEYVYYFRPRFSGNYLFPTEFAYFLRDKSTLINNSHRYMNIQ